MNAIALGNPVVSDTPSKTKHRVGIVLSALPVLFLVMDAAVKLVHAKAAEEATAVLGYPIDQLPILGVILLAATALYAIPRTAPIGAILLTGYLGGAIAIQARVGNPLFSGTLFPLYVAIPMWAGLFLRDARVQALVRSQGQR